MQICMHMHAHPYIHICMPACTHIHTHAHIHTHTHACLHTRTRAHACTHTCTHTHTHIHTHTQAPNNLTHTSPSLSFLEPRWLSSASSFSFLCRKIITSNAGNQLTNHATIPSCQQDIKSLASCKLCIPPVVSDWMNTHCSF